MRIARGKKKGRIRYPPKAGGSEEHPTKAISKKEIKFLYNGEYTERHHEIYREQYCL